ncbi:MAG: hypothetical protein HY965_07820 [Ignavibacteriales bacterium]|nr:hypothetical protein [Ignavibacteriales bacterium]
MISVIFYSCGESGTTAPQNSGSLTVSRLLPIDKNTIGTYELWGSVESSYDHGENAYRSMGRFSISNTGAITDTSGNPFSPNLGKVSNINDLSDIIITIQPPGYNDTIPSNIKILGGSKQLSGSDLVFNLSLDYIDILPASSQFQAATGNFILASPTSGIASSEYRRGLWFTRDTAGSTAGLSLPNLPDTTEWTYQAWIIDNSNSSNIYNIGRFDSPQSRDNNQQCEQSGGLIWNVPGHDWLQANCPGIIPDITNLENNYSVLITLEPRYEQGQALGLPFYIKIFSANIGINPFGFIQSLSNGYSSTVPSGQVRLSAN